MQIYRTNWTLVFVVAVCGTTIVMTGCSSSRLGKVPTPSLRLSKLPGMKWLNRDDKKTPESSLALNSPPLPSVSTSPVPPSSTGPTSSTAAVASSTGPATNTPYPTTLAPNIPYPGQNTAVYNTGPSNTGPYNTGPYNTGPSNTGPSNTGPYNTGPYNTGPYNTGPYNTGPSNTGPSNTGPSNTGPSNTGSGIANHNGQQNRNSNSAPQSGFYPTHPTTATGRQGEVLTADARSLNSYEAQARTPIPYGSSTQPNSTNPGNAYPPAYNQNQYPVQNTHVPTVNSANRYTAPTSPPGNTSSPVGNYNDRYNTTTGTPRGVIPAGNRYGQIAPTGGFPVNDRQVAPVAGSTYGEIPPPATQNNIYGTQPTVGPTTTAPVPWRPGSTTDYQSPNGVGSIPNASTVPFNPTGVVPANHASPPVGR